MAKQIAKLLKTDVMADIDMPAIAQLLRSQGRRGDSILAHINPKEAALLQKMGGAGTENPITGLPEFFENQDEPTLKDLGLDEYGESPFVYYPRKTQRQIEDDEFFSKYGDIDFSNPDFSDPITNIGLGKPPYDPYSETQKDIVKTIRNRSPSSNVTTTFPTARSESAPNVAKGQDEFGYPIMLDEADSPFQTINTDYLSDINLGGTGDFSQIPQFDQSILDTEFPTRKQPTVEDGRNVFRRGVDYLKETTGLGGRDLARLGLAAGLGIQGALASREAAKQGREARAEQERIARPYRERGAELLAKAEGGELTPQGQQSLAALRARLAQGAASRGGVGAQQAQAQVENYRQQLLANQYDYGMKISNIGDQLMLGAIRTGLEADRYATNMTSTYYTNMARILVSMGADENDLKEITKPSQGS
jgi:hypothetical protein